MHALSEHWETIEGDWAVHLHRSLLADVFTEPIGVRLLASYLTAVARIPTSGYATAVRGRPPWTHGEEQGALTAEATADAAQALRQLVSLHLDKGKTYKAKPPLKYPRPTDDDKPTVTRQDLRTKLRRG